MGLPYVCPNCGGIFTLSGLVYDPREKQDLPGMWAYKNNLGVAQNPVCYLGEGQTALVEREQNGSGLRQVGVEPQRSFKDRNSAIVTSFLKPGEL